MATEEEMDEFLDEEQLHSIVVPGQEFAADVSKMLNVPSFFCRKEV
jgi:hypothetical protein